MYPGSWRAVVTTRTALIPAHEASERQQLEVLLREHGATRAVRERQRATEHDEATKGSGNRGDRPS